MNATSLCDATEGRCVASADMISFVREVLAAFPSAVCSSAGSAAAEHVRSAAFRGAPRLAHAAAVAAADADEDSLDAALTELCGGLRDRAAQPSLLALECPEPAHLNLLRALFMCTVFIVEAASRLHAVGRRNAGAVLHGLACIAVGAVAVPQLVVLEERLLGHLGDLQELCPLIMEMLYSCEGDAGRLLTLRWASAALGHPRLAPQLWPVLPRLLGASTRLRTSAGVTSAAAFGGACSGLLLAALGGLMVDEPQELCTAGSAIDELGARCAELMRESAAESTAPLPHIAEGGSDAELRATMLCTLLFSLLPHIKAPLLPQLQRTAQELILLAAGGGRHPDGGHPGCHCATQLRAAVSAAVAGPRKQELLSWMHHLRSELLAGRL